MSTSPDVRAELLQGAAAIGRRLCAEAWFDAAGQQCNWMGRHDIQDGLLARYSVRSAAVGPELYGGSAGIALFLTELYRLTGERDCLRTARAALRRSVRFMQESPTGASPLSFFAGHLGMLYAACRLADADPPAGPAREPAGPAGLAGEVAWLRDAVLRGLEGDHTLDVISGNAG